jgi:hypothetical protein
MVHGSRDEAILGVTNTLIAAQGAGGEAAKDEDQDMVYEDGHFVTLVGASSSILMRILVEWGRRWKRRRCRLNQRRSDCGDVLVSSLIVKWKLHLYSDE